MRPTGAAAIFDAIYRPRKSNVNADVLSRLSGNVQEQDTNHETIVAISQGCIMPVRIAWLSSTRCCVALARVCTLPDSPNLSEGSKCTIMCKLCVHSVAVLRYNMFWFVQYAMN